MWAFVRQMFVYARVSPHQLDITNVHMMVLHTTACLICIELRNKGIWELTNITPFR